MFLEKSSGLVKSEFETWASNTEVSSFLDDVIINYNKEDCKRKPNSNGGPQSKRTKCNSGGAAITRSQAAAAAKLLAEAQAQVQAAVAEAALGNAQERVQTRSMTRAAAKALLANLAQEQAVRGTGLDALPSELITEITNKISAQECALASASSKLQETTRDKNLWQRFTSNHGNILEKSLIFTTVCQKINIIYEDQGTSVRYYVNIQEEGSSLQSYIFHSEPTRVKVREHDIYTFDEFKTYCDECLKVCNHIEYTEGLQVNGYNVYQVLQFKQVDGKLTRIQKSDETNTLNDQMQNAQIKDNLKQQIKDYIILHFNSDIQILGLEEDDITNIIDLITGDIYIDTYIINRAFKASPIIIIPDTVTIYLLARGFINITEIHNVIFRVIEKAVSYADTLRGQTPPPTPPPVGFVGGTKPKKIDKKVLGKQVYVIGRKQYVKYKKNWTPIADYKKVVDAKEKSNRKKAKN